MKKILMTSPTKYSIQYEINPWMNYDLGQVDQAQAARQWSHLRNVLVELGADVIVLPKSPDYCPDAVFTSNAGLLYYERFMPSRFRNDERAAEEPFFSCWFASHHFIVADDVGAANRNSFSFDGAGDALFNVDRSILWYGMGERSSFEFKAVLDRWFDHMSVIVRPLELVDSRYFNLDMCFCPLDTGELLWYPPAFSRYARMVIESWYEGKNIAVTEHDAQRFACNSISIGNALVTPFITPYLRAVLTHKGYDVHECEMSEFIKGGGACKSLTLEVVQ